MISRSIWKWIDLQTAEKELLLWVKWGWMNAQICNMWLNMGVTRNVLQQTTKAFSMKGGGDVHDYFQGHKILVFSKVMTDSHVLEFGIRWVNLLTLSFTHICKYLKSTSSAEDLPHKKSSISYKCPLPVHRQVRYVHLLRIGRGCHKSWLSSSIEFQTKRVLMQQQQGSQINPTGQVYLLMMFPTVVVFNRILNKPSTSAAVAGA